MFRFLRSLLISLLLLVTVQKLSAQQYAVTASTQIIPPYSVYLPDYGVPGSDKLRVILVQNDLTQPSYDVRLQMRVEQNGTLIMRTAASFNPKPLTLTAGVPTIIGGTDLYEYLNPANIEFSGGFSRDEYERTKSLPEGSYRISFTAYDYHRAQAQVSNAGANIFFFKKSDPPLLNLPICGSRVAMQTPQFLNFNWSSRNSPNPLPGSGTEYVFSLYEIKPAGSNADYIARSARPIYELTTESNTIVYGPGEPQLMDSMQYVWTVRARDKSGRDLFSNQGLSQSCTFTYKSNNPFAQYNIGKPVLQGRTTGERSIRLSWAFAPADAAYKVEAYRLQYRAANKNGVEFDWLTEEKLNDTAFTAGSLEPGRSYEGRLQWKVAGVYGPYSELVTVTTDPAKTFVCGDANVINTIMNNSPLPIAVPGMIFRIGHFDVILTKVSGSQGVFTGQGRVITPGFGIGLLMKFDKITVNSDLVVIKGEMQAMTEGIDKFVDDALNEQHGGNDVGKVKTGDVVPDIKTDLHIFSPANIKVDPVAGTITITDESGKEVGVIDYAAKGKSLPLVIEDADGNLYNIDKNGHVTAGGKRDAALAGNAAALAALNTLRPDKGVVIFSAAEKSVYAFDAWKDVYAGKALLEKSYESLADGKYRVSAKAIVPGVQDEVVATLQQAGSDIVPDSLKFVSGKGVLYPSKRNGSSYTITLTGGPAADAQEIFAVYPKKGGGYISMGKLLVASYAPLQKKVKLIQVGADTRVSKSVIESSLKTAYEKIGVTYTVDIDETFTSDTSWDKNHDHVLQDTKSAFLGNGFTGEEKVMLKAYKKGRAIDDEAVYFFVVNEAAVSDGDLLGKMPRGSQFGIIFIKGASDEKIGRTVAHETGHGDYTLEHTFSTNVGLDKNTTPNLMDYGNGSELVKYQWDVVHDPGNVWGIFEDDADQESVGYSDIKVFKDLINEGKNTYTFITPAGKYITLPATSGNLKFSTLDRTFYIQNGQPNVALPSNEMIALGALMSFDIDGVSYKTNIVNDQFQGYVSSKGVYKDVYSAAFNPTSGIAVFLGIKDQQFISYASRFDIGDADKNRPAEYTGAGTNRDAFSVLNFTFSEKESSLESVLEGKKIAALPLLRLSAENLFFVNQKIAFNYRGDQSKSVRGFLLDVLDGSSPLSDYIYYFTIANLKENELQAFSTCLGLHDEWDRKRVMLAVFNISQGIRIYEGGGNMFKLVREKTLQELAGSAGSDVNLLTELVAAVEQKKDADFIHNLFATKSYAACALTGLTLKERKYILDQLLKEGYNDDNWYTDAAWYQSNDGRCILKDLINTVPESDQAELLKQGFMAGNYRWLQSLWKAANEWTSGVGYEDVHDIFDIIGPWVSNHFASLGIVPTTKTFSDPMFGITGVTYSPAETNYVVGMDENESYVLDRYYTYDTRYKAGFTPVPSEVDLESDGKVHFNQAYTLRNGFPMYSEAGKTPDRSSNIFYKEEYSPFEPVSIIVAGNYAENGFNAGSQYVVPAYMAMVYDKDMERTRSSRNIRKTMNVVTIAVAVLAAPETGGSSLAMLASVTTTASAIVSSADIFIQAEKNKLSVEQYKQHKEFYEAWDNIKTTTDYANMSVAGVGALKWGWTKFGSVQKISNTVRNVKGTFANIPSSLKSLNDGWNRLRNFKIEAPKNPIPINQSKLFNGSAMTINTEGRIIEEAGMTVGPNGKLIKRGGDVDGFDDAYVSSEFGVGIEPDGLYTDVLSPSARALKTPKFPGSGGGAPTATDIETLVEKETLDAIREMEDVGLLVDANGKLRAYVKVNTGSGGAATETLVEGTIKRYKLAEVTPVNPAPEVLVLTVQEKTQLVYATAKAVEAIVKRKKEKQQCKLCQRFSQEICKKFETLEKQVGVSYELTIQRLCKGLAFEYAEAVMDKLIAMEPAIKKDFLDNISPLNLDDSHIAQNIGDINAELLDAWVLMRAAKKDVSDNYQKDFPALKQIRTARADATFIGNMGNDNGLSTLLKANKGLQCHTCETGNSFVQNAEEYMKDFKYFSDHYNTSGAGLWSDLKQLNALRMVYGAAFQLRVLRQYPELFNGTVAFDQSLDDLETSPDGANETMPATTRSLSRYDIKVNGTRYYEFKCWGENTLATFLSIPGRRTGFATQFSYYLRKVNTLNDLKYIFDGRRLSTDQAKQIIQQILIDNVDTWYASPEPGFGAAKLNALFAVTNLADLKAKIGALNNANSRGNNIYRFVNVY